MKPKNKHKDKSSDTRGEPAQQRAGGHIDGVVREPLRRRWQLLI